MNKEELYNEAKNAYYNGEAIMTDAEFDALESELGLENSGWQKKYPILKLTQRASPQLSLS